MQRQTTIVSLLAGLGESYTYYPILTRITGAATATIFLSNLIRWTGKQRNRDGWIYKTREQLAVETGMTRYEQETARRLLKQRGYLEEKVCGLPAQLHYRLNAEAIHAAWLAVENDADDPL